MHTVPKPQSSGNNSHLGLGVSIAHGHCPISRAIAQPKTCPVSHDIICHWNRSRNVRWNRSRNVRWNRSRNILQPFPERSLRKILGNFRGQVEWITRGKKPLPFFLPPPFFFERCWGQYFSYLYCCSSCHRRAILHCDSVYVVRGSQTIEDLNVVCWLSV